MTSAVVRPAGIPPPPEATIPQPVLEAAPVVLGASVIKESSQAQTEATAVLPQFMPTAMVQSIEETWAPPMGLGRTASGKLDGRLNGGDRSGSAKSDTAATIEPSP